MRTIVKIMNQPNLAFANCWNIAIVADSFSLKTLALSRIAAVFSPDFCFLAASLRAILR